MIILNTENTNSENKLNSIGIHIYITDAGLRRHLYERGCCCKLSKEVLISLLFNIVFVFLSMC